MIQRSFKINVNNNKASSEKHIVLYKGDNGLLLRLTFDNFNFVLNQIDNINCSIINVLTGKTVSLENLKLNNGIILPIGHDGLVLDEIGNYQVQLHIYDNEGARISIPPFNIEVKDTIY